LPSWDVLQENKSDPLPHDEMVARSEVIEKTLSDFGLPATVTEVRHGPAVTQYGVLPGYIERKNPNGEARWQKIRVSQIATLQKDLTLALAAPRLRIEAPVPGRGIVGIEVPNRKINTVDLRSILRSDPFIKLEANLATGLGRDVSGLPVAIDLARMPHLLIAGTTGSGKSVCINGLITSLVFNNTPDQVRLVMIDPKKVELQRFNTLPHLVGPVEIAGDRAIGVLKWVTAEMDRRYESFAEAGAKSLLDYNRKVVKYKDANPLPYICVFIDELADLILAYPSEVERTLCRLAQMARATGIHLIVATQRPSTDVITGLIKANFPARISFSVASNTDSRVILDSVGAEQLLGRGDMLYLSPEASAPARIQGCYVADEEVEAVVNHWAQKMPVDLNKRRAPWEGLIARQAVLDETDELLEQAIALAQKHEFISTSLLQRRLRLGYPRAARMMEHLFEMGLVEDPKKGGRTRRSFVEDDVDPTETLLNKGLPEA
ncbi:MAG TPA: DNA translocase FtsK, partial [Anaerolineae bacterium]|nr:DNA translocase FtsK [Anaerolineae bacterium]